MSVTLTLTECVVPRRYVLYGDESTSRELVTYCLIAIPLESNTKLQEQMLAVFRKHGGTDQSRFHSREIFSKHARDKSSWSHLTEEQSWTLARDLADVIRGNNAICSVGVVHKDTYPQSMPDGKGKTFEIKSEICYAFGFFSAAAGLSTEHGP